MKRRALLRLIAGIGIGSGLGLQSQQSRAASMTVVTALNLAGRQRMLAQRLAKAWLMLGQGLAPERARAWLEESHAAQQAGFTALQGFIPDNEVRAALTALERDWRIYRTALDTRPARASALAIYETSELTQQSAHRLVLACERTSRTPERDRPVNIAGRQRMLSQRIAKFCLFRAWDIHAQAAQMEVNFSRAEFASGMHQLFVMTADQPEARTAAADLDREWTGWRELLITGPGGGAGRRRLPAMVEGSERILTLSEQLVAMLLRYSG